FELLASPPSPHGWRLQQAIGLGAVRAEVDGVQVDGARIVTAKAGEKAFRADAFVLATGHYIGGGLRKDGSTSEPLLNLGVFHEGKAVATLGTRLEHLDYLEPAQEFRSGLSTDERLRPLDDAGRAPFENLFAAGAVMVTPMGGASGVCGALAPKRGELVLDMGGLDRILEIDEVNLTCRVESGVNGMTLEKTLNEKGLTLGHYPSSLPGTTIGGLVSTRSSGQESSRYGSIEDMVLSLAVVLPDGTFAAPR